LKIGSQTRLAELAGSELIRQHLPGLAEAIAQIASGQIRNQATVGGNLLVNNRCSYFNQSPLNRAYHDECYKAGGEVCHVIVNAKRGDPVLCRARFVSDVAPNLLALGARLSLLSAKGLRHLSLKDFYLPDGIHRNQLADGEILCAIEVPISPKRKVAYEKLRIRKAIDFASLGVAVARVGEGQARQWHLALTGVHTHPISVNDVEFDGALVTLEKLIKTAEHVAQPLKQDFLSPSYRRRMISVLAKRALARLAD
jgi:4-hydroxybenzoyl-CoA reductase subunit beta